MANEPHTPLPDDDPRPQGNGCLPIIIMFVGYLLFIPCMPLGGALVFIGFLMITAEERELTAWQERQDAKGKQQAPK